MLSLSLIGPKEGLRAWQSEVLRLTARHTLESGLATRLATGDGEVLSRRPRAPAGG